MKISTKKLRQIIREEIENTEVLDHPEFSYTHLYDLIDNLILELRSSMNAVNDRDGSYPFRYMIDDANDVLDLLNKLAVDTPIIPDVSAVEEHIEDMMDDISRGRAPSLSQLQAASTIMKKINVWVYNEILGGDPGDDSH